MNSCRLSFRLLSVAIASVVLSVLCSGPPSSASSVKTAPKGPGASPIAGRAAAAAPCNTYKSAVAGYGGWATSTSNCSFASATSSASSPAKWGYSWSLPPYSNARICVEGLGQTNDPTTNKTVAKWYSLGCGISGSGKVPWHGPKYTLKGKTYYYGVAATPKVRAKVQAGFMGAAYDWKG